MVRMRAFALILLAGCFAPAQDSPTIKVERIATGFRFTEGPVWSHEGYLIFSDIPSNRILKTKGGDITDTVREGSGGANGNALDEKGRLYTCEGNARRVTRFEKGNIEVLADKFEGKRLNSPNDIVVRNDGHVWFTDPAFGKSNDTRELAFFGVYHITPKGELSAVWRGDSRPNGVTLSPNGRILYVTDSDLRLVRAWDVDRSGATSNERVVISGITGVPDGIRTDANGNIYVACSVLAVYTPDGKKRAEINIPETPSNLAFPFNGSFDLFVTARTSVYHVHLAGAPHDKAAEKK
jgi:gluconolactonase